MQVNQAALDVATERPHPRPRPRPRPPPPVTFVLVAGYDNKTMMGFGEPAKAGGGELSRVHGDFWVCGVRVCVFKLSLPPSLLPILMGPRPFIPSANSPPLGSLVQFLPLVLPLVDGTGRADASEVTWGQACARTHPCARPQRFD